MEDQILGENAEQRIYQFQPSFLVNPAMEHANFKEHQNCKQTTHCVKSKRVLLDRVFVLSEVQTTDFPDNRGQLPPFGPVRKTAGVNVRFC